MTCLILCGLFLIVLACVLFCILQWLFYTCCTSLNRDLYFNYARRCGIFLYYVDYLYFCLFLLNYDRCVCISKGPVGFFDLFLCKILIGPDLSSHCRRVSSHPCPPLPHPHHPRTLLPGRQCRTAACPAGWPPGYFCRARRCCPVPGSLRSCRWTGSSASTPCCWGWRHPANRHRSRSATHNNGPDEKLSFGFTEIQWQWYYSKQVLLFSLCSRVKQALRVFFVSPVWISIQKILYYIPAIMY